MHPRNRLVGGLLGVCLAGLLAPAALAQGPLFPDSRLIGWTDPLGSTATTPGLLEIQELVQCPNAQVVCKDVLDRSVVQNFPQAGGTAYDPRTQVAWVSEGALLIPYEVRGCKMPCKHKAALISNQAFVSGLAHSDRNPRLFHLETSDGYYGIVTYDHRVPCQPRVLSQCRVPMSRGWTAAGLAYDERFDMLYVAAYDSTNRQNWIFVSSAKDPCNIVCRWQVPDKCVTLQRNNQIYGLAYDACRRELFATHGSVTTVISVADPQCKFALRRCCTKGSAGYYKGLAIVPGWSAKKVGKPCVSRPCGGCPNASAGLYGGDAGLGNGSFGLSLSNAPGGAIAIPVLGFGQCTNGLPLFCGQLYPSLAPVALILPAMPVSGAGCNGTAQQPLPLPNSPGFCGKPFCSQWVFFCINTLGVGTGLSDAVEFTISTS